MKHRLTIEFLLPKGFLYALLGFFILSAAPLFNNKERALIRIEQRDASRSARPYFSFSKSNSPVRGVNRFLDQEFLPSLFSHSRSFYTTFKDQTDQVLMFAPIGITLIASFLPRSSE